jgi:hypothetical protein
VRNFPQYRTCSSKTLDRTPHSSLAQSSDKGGVDGNEIARLALRRSVTEAFDELGRKSREDAKDQTALAALRVKVKRQSLDGKTEGCSKTSTSGQWSSVYILDTTDLSSQH